MILNGGRLLTREDRIMKKSAFYISSLLLLILAAACTQEFVDPDGDGGALLSKGTYATVPDIELASFDGSEAPVSRVAINSKSLAFAWSEGDRIGVVPTDGVTGQTNYTVKEIQGDARKCSFDGGAWSLKEGRTYCAYYPFAGDVGLTTSASSITIDESGQCQTANADASHLSDYLYMYAQPVTNTDGTVNFKFSHLSSIVNFVFPAPAAATYTSFSVKAEKDIFAVGSLKLSDGTVSATEARSNTFEMALDDFDLNEGDDISIFAAMFPWEYGLTSQDNGLGITLTDSEDNEYVLSARFGNMEPGKGYQVYCSPSASTTTFASVTKLAMAIGATGVQKTDLKQLSIIVGDNGGHTGEDQQVNAGLEDEIPLYARKINSGWVVLHTAAQKILLPSSINNLFSGYSVLTSDGLADWTSSKIDASHVTSASALFSGCSAMTSVSLDFLKDTKGITSTKEMFKNCSSLTSVDLSALAGKVGDLTTISDMFNGCSALESVDLSGWNTPNLTTCERTFQNCSSLPSIDLSSLDTKKVTSMYYMMDGCQKVTDIFLGQNFNFPTGSTSTTGMFRDLGSTSDNKGFCTTFHCNADQWTKAQALLDHPEDYRWAGAGALPDGAAFNAVLPDNVGSVDFVVSSSPKGGETEVFPNIYKSVSGTAVTFRINAGKFLLSSSDMSGMFKGKQALTTVSGLHHIDWTGVTDFSEMFSGCTSLTLSGIASFQFKECNLRGEALSNMSGMFRGCSSLTGIPLPSSFSTASVTDMSYMLAGSNVSYQVINTFDTSSLVNASHMFEGWQGTVLDLTGWNVRKVENMESMFENSNLKQLKTEGWNTSRLLHVKNMFKGCSSLLSTSTFVLDVSKVQDMSSMFYGCSGLGEMDLSHFRNDIVTNVDNMFYGCTSLYRLDIRNLDTRYASTAGTFNDCCDMQHLTVGSGFQLASVEAFSLTFRNFGTEYHERYHGRTAIDCPSAHWDNVFSIALKNAYSDWEDRFYCYQKAVLPSGYDFNRTARYLAGNQLDRINKIEFRRSSIEIPGEQSADAPSAPIHMSFDDSNGTLVVRTSGDRFYLNRNAGAEEAGSQGMFSTMTSLSEIVGIGDINASEAVQLNSLFSFCYKLPALKLCWDVSNVKNMNDMFLDCKGLTSIDISTWDTSNVEGMVTMFYGCSSLTSIDLSALNTSNVKSMYGMFCNCGALTSLDVSHFNTANVINFNGMFMGCSSLQNLDLSNFDFTLSVEKECEQTSNTRDGMFNGCSSLKTLRLSPSFEPRYRKKDGTWYPVDATHYSMVFNNMGIKNPKPYTTIYCTYSQWQSIKECLETNGQNPSDYNAYASD